MSPHCLEIKGSSKSQDYIYKNFYLYGSQVINIYDGHGSYMYTCSNGGTGTGAWAWYSGDPYSGNQSDNMYMMAVIHVVMGWLLARATQE